jgi:Hsp70 protein.
MDGIDIENTNDFQKQIDSALKQFPLKQHLDPDKAVANGAALQAHYLTSNSKDGNILLGNNT